MQTLKLPGAQKKTWRASFPSTARSGNATRGISARPTQGTQMFRHTMASSVLRTWERIAHDKPSPNKCPSSRAFVRPSRVCPGDTGLTTHRFRPTGKLGGRKYRVPAGRGSCPSIRRLPRRRTHVRTRTIGQRPSNLRPEREATWRPPRGAMGHSHSAFRRGPRPT